MSKNQPEFQLQVLICEWLKIQHPEILFMSDTIASIKLTAQQQVRNKKIQKENFKLPDLLIFEPNKEFNGLFIELKVKSPFKKDGTILKDEHLEGQLKTIEDLKKKGYYACFSWSFDMTINIINTFLNNR